MSELLLPVLDLTKQAHPSFLSSLAQACQEWGFFYVANHGIPKTFFSRLRRLSNDVFTLPQDRKRKLGPSSCIKSYTPHFIASPYFESLRVSGPDFFTSAKSSADVLFDQESSEFSEVLQEYGHRMVELSIQVTKVVLNSIGEDYERRFYDSEFGSCHGYLRIVSYTPPENVEEMEAEGLGMHTDMSCITIVCQDEVGGLQVRSQNGEWMDIHPREDFLVVNIGDLMQAWSNGRLRSSEHRVVLKKHMNRFSLAFFWCFPDEKVVWAPEEVVGLGVRRNYRPFVCVDYVKFRESSEVGKFERIKYTVLDFAGLESKADEIASDENGFSPRKQGFEVRADSLPLGRVNELDFRSDTLVNSAQNKTSSRANGNSQEAEGETK